MRTDLTAEKAVLGSILQRPAKFQDAAKHILNTEYFFYDKNRIVWKALEEIIVDGGKVDFVILHSKLASEIESGKIEMSYLSELTDAIPSPEVCEKYAEIVAEEYRARQLAKCTTILLDEINNRTQDNSQIAWENFHGATQKIFSATNSPDKPCIITLASELSTINPEIGWGTPWGIQEIDKTFGEVAPGAIVVLGGRPGHCKTALAVQLIDNWLDAGKRVLFHSLEMTWRELNMRRLSRISSIPAWRIKRGYEYYRNQQDATFAGRMDHATQWIFNHEQNLIIKDAASLSPQQIALSVRLEDDTHKIDFLVLDHFHLLNFSGNKEERFLRDEGLRTIVSACKGRGITPVILAQLNRNIESEGRNEPRLSDLREVGSLEEMATNVLFTFWKYKVSHDDNDLHELNVFQLKARDGATGQVKLFIDPEIYRIGGFNDAKN